MGCCSDSCDVHVNVGLRSRAVAHDTLPVICANLWSGSSSTDDVDHYNIRNSDPKETPS